MSKWRYYNHAAIPTTAPHETVEITDIENGEIWKRYPKALLARWTSDWDCGYETSWWYVIKDTPFDISSIKAKRRYEINKGLKSFEVRKIENVSEYAEQFYEIAIDSYADYPKAYRPIVEREKYIAQVKTWFDQDVYGAFSKEDNTLKAWACLKPYERYSDFIRMKSVRSQEKLGVNAALIFGILEDYNYKFMDGYYICDGARSVNHETAFQDYLEKYFEFRKAYCKLHIEYAPKMSFAMKVLFPLRRVIRCIHSKGIVHNINSILQMEEIVRQEK